MPKSEYAQVDELRKKYYKESVYVHVCDGCQKTGQMLHADCCVLCGQQNQYYDSSLQVSQRVSQAVIEELQSIYRSQDMSQSQK